MSLDETYEALINFSRELKQFDERLRAARMQIRDKHQAIDGIWRDRLRLQYDSQLEELDRQISVYAESRSEQFEEFLRSKIAQLRNYLHGN
jgi:hypothetical protein